MISIFLVYPDDLSCALGSPGFREVFRTLHMDSRFEVNWGWYDSKNHKVIHRFGEPGKKYSLIGMSVPYEPMYSNAVRALISLGIEPEKTKRKKGPSVLLGGAAPIMNPAVAGMIADLVYTGESEAGLKEMLLEWETGTARTLAPRGQKPSFSAVSRFHLSSEIDSSFLDGFDDPSGGVFEDAGLVEVGRGCSRGCRFCAAGHIYLPFRNRTPEDIFRDVETYRGKASRIGLVGASLSDHKDLKIIMKGIIGMGFGITTSSFRADMIDSELASVLFRGGLRTVTIAPEGGSARTRNIMNKRLSEEKIIDAARYCTEAGINSLRLYYIVGIPWEKPMDIEAISELSLKIRKTSSVPNTRLTVSLNPFIPKPQTPFQWAPMAGAGYVENAYKSIGKRLKKAGIGIKTLSIRMAEREGIISLGGEDVGKAVIENARDGIPWKKALLNNSIKSDELLHSEKTASHVFPWDDESCEPTKKALRASYEKARNAALE